MATDPITEVVATENQTVVQVKSFSTTQTVAPTSHVTVLVNHGEKSEKLLTEDVPKLKQGEGDIQAVSSVEAWKHSDFLCQNYVMNGLADSLYNVYSTMKTAKELWESLD
ncbi:CCHC-type domain-containing protein [Abeliophyllum distichum]|uniref:CCHC-type domain-containing protein n=1 Tax=Abeliophyllum distichum TaxID=126358 RepID=A0ABD1UQS4_9LAMI